MKNVLIISTTEEEMLSNVNDGTNRLFINGSEIPSSDWVGTGNYTATVEGHAVTIAKADTLDGNISLARTGDYTYEMRKRTPSSGTGVESIVQTTTSHEDGGVNVVTCTLTDGTETEFEIRNGQKGSTGAAGAAAGFGTPTASVDANIGTPSVTVTASGADTAKVFDFAFHNLKGAQGSQGQTGATPNISMSASVDANVGTPAVTVTKSGTDENPNFALAFQNLKGEYASVDTALSNTSKNPVQNKVITAALNALDEDVEHPYVMSSDIAYNPDLKKITSTKTTSTWGDSQIASNCGYVNDVFLTAKPNQTNAQIIFGLDSNPNQAATYSDIDYAWYVESGRTYIYESGTLVTVPSAYSYFSAGTELKIVYSGGFVRYYHNGSLVRSVSRSLGSPLYMNIMFKNAGALYDVDFGVGIGEDGHVTLYSGTSKITGDSLKEAYTHFRYLLIVGITNVEFVSVMVPTSMIVSNKDIMLTAFGSSSSSEAVSSWNLMSQLRIRFNSTTTFQAFYQYTNSNWIVKPYAIYGIP